MSDHGDNDTTAQTLAEMQATMKAFHEELQALKRGATSVATPLAGSTQQPDAPRGVGDYGNPTLRSGEVGQRKRRRETNEEDDDTRDRGSSKPDDEEEEYDSMEENETFPLSETGNAFLEAAFSKRMNNTSYTSKIKKHGTPDSRWTRCPELDAVVLANLPKETVSADSKAKRLHSFWLSAAAPLAAGLQDIEDGRGDIQDAAKAMQAALVLLGNASQHHAVQRRQVIQQQLNPKLKSLIKDEDFRDAPPFLFGERFASVAKERLDTAPVLKKTVVTGKPVFQRNHP